MSDKQARGPEWVRGTPQYVAVADQAGKAQEAARAATAVTDEASCASAAELLSKVAKVVKYIDKQRLDTADPYRKSTKAIDAEFKELAAPLIGVETRLREEVEDFEAKRRAAEAEARRKHEAEVAEHERKVREAEEARLKAEEDARIAAEQAAAAAKAAAEPPPPPPPPPEPVPAPPPPPPPPPPPAASGKRSTTTGSVSTRTEWKYEVINFAELSDDLKILNQAEATRRVRGGDRDIPGLRIYPVEKLHVR